jgi:HAD superfamily hydrolase (TIGR01549 family)
MIEERSFEERERLSAPCMRTFVNIGRRWRLTEGQQASLLTVDILTLRTWVAAATEHQPLVLETNTLMRLSALLGVFGDLRRFLTEMSGAHEERIWLLCSQLSSPFNGRTPLELLCGNFQEQMAVRRHMAAVAVDANPWGEVGFEHLQQADFGYLDARNAMPIEAICFDGFGTLVEIREKRRAFQSLIAGEISDELVQYAMKSPIGLRELSQRLCTPISEERLLDLEADLATELNSVRPRDGMDRIWQTIQRAGLKIGICSNLALPYREPLLAHIPSTPDVLALSFEAGVIKPQPEIYRRVCIQLGLLPAQVLWVGDSMKADVIGPSMIGAFSMPISEFERSYANGVSFYAPRQVAAVFERLAAAENA